MRDTLLVELLTEELPPKALYSLGEAFKRGVVAGLAEAKFIDNDISACLDVLATPRRLAVLVADVTDMQAEQTVERKGPYVAQGLLADGQAGPALQGFLRSCGTTLEQLSRGQDGKGEFFLFRSTKQGESLDRNLVEIVLAALKKLPTPKLMRWGDQDEQFVRPVHGLVMMHGRRVVPGTVLGVTSSASTQGHRFLGAGVVALGSAADYAQCLEQDGRSLVAFGRRRAKIHEALQQAALKNEGALPSDIGPLLDEVTALVEYPAVYTGRFDPAFLAVPQECLILSMKQHQKYFPLLDAKGALLPRFLIVSNLETDEPADIIRGNERVLRARLSDAKFFFDQDRKRKLEDRVPQLAQVVYHNKLGNQLERVERIRGLAGIIAGLLGSHAAHAQRAAYLSKADLLTDMVGEFPELQGIMGQYYARHDSEPEVVAGAIEAHYHPRFASDTLPADLTGCAVALADKLDTLVGIYGIGLVPTGDKDPFGLRRHALGVLRLLSERSLPLDVKVLLEHARAGFEGKGVSESVVPDLHGFMLDRLRGYLRESSRAIDPSRVSVTELGGVVREIEGQNFQADEIESVLSDAPVRIDQVLPRLLAVQNFRKLPEAAQLASANKRARNILRKSPAPAGGWNPALMTDAAEKALANSLAGIRTGVDTAARAGQYTQALTLLASVSGPVNTFFDEVLVNHEEAAIRDNRLRILAELATLLNAVADISRLVPEK
jgi:glycyl-tRNA synthetase beta chain